MKITFNDRQSEFGVRLYGCSTRNSREPQEALFVCSDKITAISLILFIASGCLAMTSDRPHRLISKIRRVRYGGVFPVMSDDKKLQADVCGTQLITDCHTALWHALNADEIAEDACLILGSLISVRCVRLTMIRGIYEPH